MHPDMLHLAERLVSAMEGMHEEVKNMSASVRDLTRSVSQILEERKEKESRAPVTSVGTDSDPSVASAARQDVCVKSEYSLQHEQTNVISVPYSDVLEQEEISVGDDVSADIDHPEYDDVLSSCTGEMKIEEVSESEENAGSDAMLTTIENGRNNAMELYKEMHQEGHIENSATSFVSEVLSSSPHPSSAEERRSCTSEHRTSVGRSQGRDPFTVRSCSTADEIIVGEESYHRNLSYRHEEETMEGGGLDQCISQSESESFAYSDGTLFGKEASGCASVRSPCEEGVRESRSRVFECSTQEMKSASERIDESPTLKDKEERLFKCNQCWKAFKRSDTLTSHMRTHTGEKPFKCSQCAKSFTQSSSLYIHMRNHTGERSFECNQCGKTFKRSDKLTLHMRTHTGEKPFGCSQCGMVFKRSDTRNLHMKTHTGEKPYKCLQCGQAFKSSYKLSIHMRNHTGEKPYKCSQCGKTFKRSDALTLHMKSSHKGNASEKQLV